MKRNMSSYLKDKGYEARAFYLNVLYVLFILLASLFAATLNAGEHFEVVGKEDFSLSRFQACKLAGNNAADTADLAAANTARLAAEAADTDAPAGICMKFGGLPAEKDADFNIVAADQELFDAQQVLFNIAVATAVVNSLLFAWSVAMHWKGFGISVHYMLQAAFSLINVGMFAGLVGWLSSIEDLNADINILNNLFFDDLNVFAVAVAGLVIAALDLVGSNLVIYWACKSYKCWSE